MAESDSKDGAGDRQHEGNGAKDARVPRYPPFRGHPWTLTCKEPLHVRVPADRSQWKAAVDIRQEGLVGPQGESTTGA